MGGYDGQDVAVGIKVKLIDAHLTVEAMHAAGQVMAVVDDIVLTVFLKDAVMTRSVYGLVGIGLEDAALIFEGTHRSHL